MAPPVESKINNLCWEAQSSLPDSTHKIEHILQFYCVVFIVKSFPVFYVEF